MNFNAAQLHTDYLSGAVAAHEIIQQLRRVVDDDAADHSLSQTQLGMWAHQRTHPKSTAFNCPVLFRTNVRLDAERLASSWKRVVSTFPALRSVLRSVNGAPRRLVLPRLDAKLETIDARGGSLDDIRRSLSERATVPFDIENGPLFRACLFQCPKDSYVGLILHHLIFDGGSLRPLLLSLARAYGYSEREDLSFEPARHYDEYVEDERRRLDSETGRDCLSFWKRELSGASLGVPLFGGVNGVRGEKNAVFSFTLSKSIARQIDELAARNGLYPSSILFAAYTLVLKRLADIRSVLVETPFDQRAESDVGNIGCYINSLIVQVAGDGEETFLESARDAQLKMIEAIDNRYPFRLLGKATAYDENRLSVAFSFQDFDSQQEINLALRAADSPLLVEIDRGTTQTGAYDLNLEVYPYETGYWLNIVYKTATLGSVLAESIADGLQGLLTAALQDPLCRVSGLPAMSAARRQTILQDRNPLQKPRDSSIRVYDLIANSARATPNAAAVRTPLKTLTYAELIAEAEQLAERIALLPTDRNRLVAVFLPRTTDLPVALLAIDEAGCAYLPLDPSFPAERLRQIVRDSGVRCVLTHSDCKEKIAAIDASLEAVALDEPADRNAVVRGAAAAVSTNNLAYVIYTSGSTGRPKGVAVTHSALVNFLLSMAVAPGFGRADTILAVTTVCFDISGLELFLPLIVGGCCYLADAETARDPKALLRLMAQVRPTVMQATPTTWSLLFAAGWKNEERIRILCGGEALPATLAQRFLRADYEVWNLYGPTETTVWSTLKRLDGSKAVTIGRPIDNTRVYVLDRRMQLAPDGIVGELFIGGAGVAAGYLGAPDLTSQRFLQDSFNPGATMYRTGDLVRWLQTSEAPELEFIGRADQQVKIKGHRIEPGDIEEKLARHADVAECVVTARQEGESKHLIAWCRFAPAATAPRDAQLRRFLAQLLPDYMIPSKFVAVEAFPVTPNGKIDRMALSSLTLPRTNGTSEDRGAGEAIKRRVLEIWREALGQQSFAEEDGFFDAGGDSVLAVIVAERLGAAFGIQVAPSDVFKSPSVVAMAEAVSAKLAAKPLAYSGDHAPGESVRSAARPKAEPTVTQDTGDHQDEAATPRADGVAIVGIAVSFPDAAHHRLFWRNLCAGLESVRRVHDGAVTPPQGEYVPAASSITGKNFFDHEFFGLSLKDARMLDPQARLLLRDAWRAVEDAGYRPDAIDDAAVYTAVSNHHHMGAALQGRRVMEAPDDYVAWVLSQPGTLPALISNKLMVKGPSLAVHSNCSSSLVALSLAFRDIATGRVKHALVGAASFADPGIAGYVHQPGLNFSSDGRVKPFDADADGMVGGEGVAAILLKSAADAYADGDHIYAILRSVEVNNDGAEKVGFYAPSLTGQSALIERALRSADVDPDTVSLVEAHGTGTKLGDPIEVRALQDAYRKFTDKVGFCAIGSVKSNVGHLDATAGLAGCIKAALSLANGKVAPTINYRQANPQIDFATSCFHVADRLITLEKRATPHRAAVSAFGIGGTNAHAILEQALTPAERSNDAGLNVLPISALSPAALSRYVRELLAYLRDAREGAGLRLDDLAYTFQVGRKPMAHRLAIVTHGLEDLAGKLEAFLTPAVSKIEGVYVGQAGSNAVGDMLSDGDAADLVDRWIRAEQWDKVARLWTLGAPVDWETIKTHSGREAPRRISAPTYPFEPTQIRREAGNEESSALRLHPLLHRSVGGDAGLQFETTFDGREFFLVDHVIGGRPVLPGVVMLEMARAAAVRAFGVEPVSQVSLDLKQCVWRKPVIFEPALGPLRLSLTAKGEKRYALELTQPEMTSGLHFQATAELRAEVEDVRLDVARMRASFAEQGVPGSTIYSGQDRDRFLHGGSLQGVKEIFARTRDDAEFDYLVRLQAPARTAAERDPMLRMHPAVLDAALQAAFHVALAPESDRRTFPAPFALRRLSLLRALPLQMWALIKTSSGHGGASEASEIGIDLVDDEGFVCASLEGLTYRPIDSGASDRHAALMFAPRWRPRAHSGSNTPVETPHFVYFCASGAPLVRRRVDLSTGAAQLVPPAFEEQNCRPALIAESFREFAGALLADIQTMSRAAGFAGVFVQVVINGSRESGPLLGLDGMLRTMELELPNVRTQLLVTRLADGGLVADRILLEARQTSDRCVRYDGAQRLVEDVSEAPLETAKLSDKPPSWPWRADGVYVVSGGLGKIGRHFLADIARRAPGCKVLAFGRSAAQTKAAVCESLAREGIQVEYRQADIRRREDVEALVAYARREYGAISGVLHFAGASADRLTINKPIEEFDAVLAVKVLGAALLDEATRDDLLDIFLLASSVSAHGNPGQADYAAANAFLDRFAAYRQSLVEHGVRRGRTLSMAWSLWADGGFAVTDVAKAKLLRDKGVAPMPTPLGVKMFYSALASQATHVVATHGDIGALRSAFLSDSRTPPSSPEPRDAASGAQSLRRALKQMVVELSGADVADIDEDRNLGAYGIDSIGFTDLANRINRRFGFDLLPTVFFEHGSLNALVDHLARTDPDKIRAPDGNFAAIAEAAAPANPAAPDAHLSTADSVRRLEKDERGPVSEALLGCAIVGMSGQFPGADDIEGFWRNLVEGRDCITEIPGDRWDWREIYGDPQGQAGKTNVKWGGFIDGALGFDPEFFNISPREAISMDPHHRLLLMHAWNAIADAGYASQSLAGERVGVFVATDGSSGYSTLTSKAGVATTDAFGATGSVPSMGPNRVSFFFDFRGPSEPVETACSSSLVAVERALSAIRSGACSMALVGGVNVILTEKAHLVFSHAGALSPEGRCKTFSSDADGFALSEGVGVVLIKPLGAAEADGDDIYAVIKSAAVNHGGRANSLTSPNAESQASLISASLRLAQVPVTSIGFIETHGTGTKLGDPIEIEALKRAFETAGAPNSSQPYCGLGSVKSNIGHSVLAAGIAGVIKTALQLRAKTLVKSLHAENLNPLIRLAGSPFYVVRENQYWPQPRVQNGVASPRRAGVSSFGLGGVNAHVVLEEYVPREVIDAAESETPPALLVLSAKSEAQLRTSAARLSARLKALSTDASAANGPQAERATLLRVAYTLQVGRDAFRWRVALAAESLSDAVQKLDAVAKGQGAQEGAFLGTAIEDADRDRRVDAAKGAMTPWKARDYDRAMAQWVTGAEVDWRELYRGRRMRRLHLPGYPFAIRDFRPNAPMEQAMPQTEQPDNALRETRSPRRSAKITLASLSRNPSLDARSAAPAETSPVVQERRNPPHVDRHESLMADLRRSLSEELLIPEEDIENRRDFASLGVDSVTGVNWIKKIAKLTGVVLPVTAIYEHSSLEKLFRHLSVLAPQKGAQSPQPTRPAPVVSPLEASRNEAHKAAAPATVSGADDVAAFLLSSLAQELMIDEALIDTHTTFELAGLDSVTGASWLRKLNARLGLNLPMADILAHPRISDFIAFVQTSVCGKRLVPARPETPIPPRTEAGGPSLPAGIASRRPGREQAPEDRVIDDQKLLAAGAAGPAQDTRIAVIGVSGRFPGAANLEKFWRRIAGGDICIEEIPAGRWDGDAYYSATPGQPGKSMSKWMGVLEHADAFDASFFGVSPVEAELMDPQQRVFLETAWACFEDAGYTPERLAGRRCGVFVGCISGDYVNLAPGAAPHALMGAATSILSARISYFLDLRGPNVAVDTACSSSLVAVAQACDSLLLGSADMALAGGVSVIAGPSVGVLMSAAGMLSPDGRCFTFDRRANGFVPAEGVGAVLLKRFADAERDGDMIYAVIDGWGVNCDGATNGITAPNPAAQTELQREVYRRFGVDPASVQLVETHGTGTKLGDPIEAKALIDTFSGAGRASASCALGSVKANIGHALAAAGIAGLLKTVLALHKRQLPPMAGFDALNEHIELEGTPFYIDTVAKPWTTPPAGLRRAAINSFGFSGTNAHITVREAKATGSVRADASIGPEFLMLSAKSEDGLKRYADDIAAYLKAQTNVDLSALANAYRTGRASFRFRLTIAFETREQLLESLAAYGEGRFDARRRFGDAASGQGTVKSAAPTAGVDLQSLLEICDSWVHGVDIDWTKKPDRGLPRLGLLPTYPFARDRYWRRAAIPTGVGAAQRDEAQSRKREVIGQGSVLTQERRAALQTALHDDRQRRLVLEMLLASLQQAQLLDRRAEAGREALRRLPPYLHEWLAVSLDWLGRHGLIAQRSLEVATEIAPMRDLAGLWREWERESARWRDDAVAGPRMKAVETCLRALPAILRGEMRAVEALFPDGSLKVVEPLYAGNPVSDHFAAVVARQVSDAVADLLKSRPEGGVRLLEIGAGTGATAGKTLEALEPFTEHIAEYAYTDVSKRFLNVARQKFVAGRGYLKLKRLDIDASPLEQEFVAGAYDIVLASDVLHATKDIGVTLSHVAMLLRDGGRLIVNEVIDGGIHAHLTVGLLEGWWGYRDANIRTPGCPALAPTQWEASLARSGFHDVVFPAADDHGLGQQIFVATFNRSANVQHLPHIHNVVISCLSETLAIPVVQIGPEDAFADLGMDSILTTGFVGRLNKALSLTLKPSISFECRSVVELAERVAGMVGSVAAVPISAPPPLVPRAAEMTTSAPSGRIREAVLSCLAETLQMDSREIGEDRTFAELGVGAAVIDLFVERLNKRIGLNLTPATVFDAPSVERLCEYLTSVPTQAHTPESSGTPVSTEQQPDREWIAVIGMSGRFPKARNYNEFWRNLLDGVIGVEELPSDYLDLERHFRPERMPGKTYCKWGGTLPGKFEFEPLFFNISPNEAQSFKPEQRIVLVESWRAIEDAGYDPRSLAGTAAGVYFGASAGADFSSSFIGSSDAFIAARVSYCLNLRGPALVLDTTCSSSGVAIHLACEALRRGEIELAVAGGVFASLDATSLVRMSQMEMLSPTGQCRAFDSRADGTVMAEGVGVVVLKRYRDAVRDGDPIHGVIVASGVNQDGASNGITAPNGQAQQKLICDTYARFGVDARQVTLLEAHGTGTPLGDPVEVDALMRAFASFGSRDAPRYLGGVKANVGHTGTASAAAGLIKALLAIKHRKIPGQPYCEEINPLIQLDDGGFVVNRSTVEWPPSQSGARMAAVNSFGASGTNVHIVVREATPLAVA